MIRINLANKSTFQAQMGPQISDLGEVILTRDEMLKQAGVRVFIIILFPVLIMLYQDYYLVPDLRQKNSIKEQELADLKDYNSKREASVNEIKKYGEEKINIERKIDILNKINRERGRELELHKFFQKAIPDRVWLTEYDYDQANDKIILKGSSFFASDIPKFRQEIQTNVMFKSVEVSEQKEGKLQGQSIEEFEMVINLEKFGEPNSQ